MRTEVKPTEDQQRELGSILWRYRSSLERVEFLLEAQLIFGSSGRDNRLAVIADLLDETATSIGELDLHREVLLHNSQDTSDQFGADRPPSLSQLAELSDEPWSTMFRDHQRWFEQTVLRLQQLTNQGRHTMSATLDLIDQLVNNDSKPSGTGYDRQGRTVRSSSRSVLFDSRA